MSHVCCLQVLKNRGNLLLLVSPLASLIISADR